MKTIAEYIVFDFKNIVNNDYKNRTTFILSKLKNVKLKQKNKRLIKNISKIIFIENKYVLNLNIYLTLLFDKKIITSFKKSLMNIFNTFMLFSQIVQFTLFLQRHSFTLFSKFYFVYCLFF